MEYIFVKVEFALTTRNTSLITKDRLQSTVLSFTLCCKEIKLIVKPGCTGTFRIQISLYILLFCRAKIKPSKDLKNADILCYHKYVKGL